MTMFIQELNYKIIFIGENSLYYKEKEKIPILFKINLIF